jgi:AbrB family looped-hinge helix DNA binding protein
MDYHNAMTTTITSKGQITIPAAIRRRLHLQPGMRLEFDENADFLKATPAFDVKEMRAVLGCCRQGRRKTSVKQWLNETRGPVSLPTEAHDHRR